MKRTTCPCCSDGLLRHFRPTGIYWFCMNCHQEMPVDLPELHPSVHLSILTFSAQTILSVRYFCQQVMPTIMDQKTTLASKGLS